MHIAIIGTGNVGSALATQWAQAGHTINLGVRNPETFKGKHLLQNTRISVFNIAGAVEGSEVILLAIPATKAVEVAIALGDTHGKVIIDAMNIVKGNGPAGFTNTADAVLQHTQTSEVVKCFNTTGFNNMVDTNYRGTAIDMFSCGDSKKGKEVAAQLSKDAGFAACYHIGGNEHFELIEKFAFFWINLAMFQGQGREIAFKLLKR